MLDLDKKAVACRVEDNAQRGSHVEHDHEEHRAHLMGLWVGGGVRGRERGGEGGRERRPSTNSGRGGGQYHQPAVRPLPRQQHLHRSRKTGYGEVPTREFKTCNGEIPT